MKIRILLADDHQLMREGLRAILAKEPDMDLIGEAANGRESIELAESLRPEVVIMDVAMSDLNGIEATRMIKRRWPRTRVVALSSHDDRRLVIAILEAGADAYVLKAGAFDDLSRAVRAVHEGKRYLCPEVAGIVVDAGLREPRETSRQDSPFEVLTPREREVLQLVAEGLASSQIAGRLGVSTHTIDTHRRNLMRKLGLHNAADVTRYAIREGLAGSDS